MIRPRIIPCLLLRGTGLVKGVRFKNHRYVGDPINAVKIFNDKEVDELVFLDITATREGRRISAELAQQIADECYMPFAVGGGITSVAEIRQLLSAGAEKVVINSGLLERPSLIREASGVFGNQSIVVAIDVKKRWTGSYEVYSHAGSRRRKLGPTEWAKQAEELGAGELFLTSIDRDGTWEGYDLDLVRSVASAVSIPVIACGGAGCLQHLIDAAHLGNASAASAGSFFVFHGRRRAVLISFPTKQELDEAFGGGERRGP